MISHRLTVLFDPSRFDQAYILWLIDTVPPPPYTRTAFCSWLSKWLMPMIVTNHVPLRR
jgi:hypothetical protein